MAIPVWRLVLGGLRSLVMTPPVGTGGTVSARYCYSVFMRHRIVAAQYGLVNTPRHVVELGPGDSLGIGLMALLTGSERYVAIDAVRHASTAANLAVFDELVALLRNRTPVPYEGDCSEIWPELKDYAFPHEILDDSILDDALAPARLEGIRESLSSEQADGVIQYLAPMGEMGGIPSDSIDWIFSQAVLEHVDKLEETYHQCFRCLKPGGLMTHQIDFRCHDTAPEWNGHWKYSRWFWGVMRGRRPWFVNRLPYSVHRKMQQEAGFRILGTMPYILKDGIDREKLAAAFRSLTDDDLHTAGALVVSKKSVRDE